VFIMTQSVSIKKDGRVFEIAVEDGEDVELDLGGVFVGIYSNC